MIHNSCMKKDLVYFMEKDLVYFREISVRG
jgi:hypothetical protein